MEQTAIIIYGVVSRWYRRVTVPRRQRRLPLARVVGDMRNVMDCLLCRAWGHEPYQSTPCSSNTSKKIKIRLVRST